ncbi:hypothetical protein BDZ94DRAFT_1191650 [Collybia nuda]|uniref:Asl1-like glycosyl hydrolase catalytic domain-containing protein n=1 Tax=Collybia nuda TaxID=64659 RepID=A0A9P6CFI7_9AGAR|nr:hypothetical protein BDZ94DRAFT_1191650 [Collybia nuda]
MHILRSLCCAFALLAPSVIAAKNPKRGLAFAEGDNPNDIKNADQAASVLSWQYDWGTAPPDYLAKTTIPYIPMQWGVNGIETFASKVKAQGAKTILAFNEPDFASQSNINATYAAQLWKQYIQPLAASGVRLGAPAVTNAPSGRPWLAQFLAACTGCTIDFIPFHWYGTGIGNFYDYLWQMHGQFPSYPLWVTEFATTSTNDAEVVDFLNSTIRYMDTLDWIQGYAWFAYFRKEGTSHYNLLDVNGNLNDLGKIYVNA